jgi:hypothetical protein
MAVHVVAANLAHFGRGEPGVFLFRGKVQTNRIPARPVIVLRLVHEEDVSTELEEQTSLACDRVLRKVWRCHTGDRLLVPHDLVSKREGLGCGESAGKPKAPQIRRVPPNVRARVGVQVRAECFPPAHLELVELGAVEVIVYDAVGFFPHAVGRIGVHELRARASHQARDIGLGRAVAAHDAMLAEQPHIASPRYRNLFEFRYRILVRIRFRTARQVEQVRQLCIAEAKLRKIDVGVVELSQFERQEFQVPPGVKREFVVGDDVRAALFLTQSGQNDAGHFLELQLIRREHTTVPRDDLPALVNQHRVRESEVLDAVGDL